MSREKLLNDTNRAAVDAAAAAFRAKVAELEAARRQAQQDLDAAVFAALELTETKDARQLIGGGRTRACHVERIHVGHAALFADISYGCTSTSVTLDMLYRL